MKRKDFLKTSIGVRLLSLTPFSLLTNKKENNSSTLIAILFFAIGIVNAQVGIGTITPEEMLHNAGKAVIDTVPYNATNTQFMSWNETDRILSWTDLPTGTSTDDALIHSAELNLNSFGSSVDFDSGVDGVWDSVDLDISMSLTTSLPDDRFGMMIIEWNLPISTTASGTDAYVGTTLFLNGVAQTGAGRVTPVWRIKGENTITITGTAILWLPANTSGATQNYTVSIRPYIHQLVSGTASIYQFKAHTYSSGSLNIQTYRRHITPGPLPYTIIQTFN